MIEKIGDRVRVAMIYSPEEGEPFPCRIAWRKKKWRVTEYGLHHIHKEGDRPLHTYQVVVDGYLQMRLLFDAWSLIWTLEEVSDGQAE